MDQNLFWKLDYIENKDFYYDVSLEYIEQISEAYGFGVDPLAFLGLLLVNTGLVSIEVGGLNS